MELCYSHIIGGREILKEDNNGKTKKHVNKDNVYYGPNGLRIVGPFACQFLVSGPTFLSTHGV